MKKEVMRRVKRSKKKPKPIQQSLASAQEPGLLLALTSLGDGLSRSEGDFVTQLL